MEIDQLIYVSSTTVNAINSISDPQNYYGLSKALGERLLKINKNHFSQASILRFPSVMGVNHYGGIRYEFKKWIENGNDINLYDGGKKYRNILHVDDAVSAIVKT